MTPTPFLFLTGTFATHFPCLPLCVDASFLPYNDQFSDRLNRTASPEAAHRTLFLNHSFLYSPSTVFHEMVRRPNFVHISLVSRVRITSIPYRTQPRLEFFLPEVLSKYHRTLGNHIHNINIYAET